MGIIKLTEQGDKFILMNTLEKKEVVNEDLINVVKSTGFKGVAPFEIKQVRNKRVILTDLTGTYSILTRLQSSIDSRELLLILRGLLNSFKEVSDRRIPPTNIDLSLDYIFIRRDGSVLLTLWALDGLKPKTTLRELLRKIGTEAKPNSSRDKNFINAYLKLFEGEFSLVGLDDFVESNYKMLKTSAMDANSNSPTGTNKNFAKSPEPVIAEAVDKPVTPQNKVVEEDEDVLVPTGQTTFLTDIDDDDDDADGKTAMLTDEVNINRFLLRVNTGDKYPINGSESIVGKQGADIALTGNKAISREHAKVIIFDGVVSLEDLNSSNGTKLNGVKIESGATVDIVSGDEVTLANEQFEYIEE